jgi:Undecaprenyl-phosphate glucose phosphotransferase
MTVNSSASDVMTVDSSAADVEHQMPVAATSLSDGAISGVTGRLERLLVRIVALEFLLIAGTCYLTSAIYYGTFLATWPPIEHYVPAALSIALLVLLTALGFKHYIGVQAQSRDRFMWSGIGAVALAFSLFLSLLFVFKIADWYSRGTFFFQFMGASIAMLMTRATMHAHIRRAITSGAVEARRAVFIGDPNDNRDILNNLRQSGIRSVGNLPLPYIHGNTVPGVGAFSRNIRSFVEKCRAFEPDDIIFLATPSDLPRIACVADALSELPVTVHIIPMGASDLWASSKVVNFGGTVTVQVLHPPLSAFDLAAKRAFDICIAGLGLLMLSPLLLAVSLAIRLDSRGPVFFRQIRHGYNNEVIGVLKFRSMTTIEDGRHFKQAVKNDPRVTRAGRILRPTNIDELPQLVNVLLGEMSIVGPRPHPIALNETFAEQISPFSRRHKVKPGITGWAQVNGYRGETDTIEKMRRRIECDLYYIDNWSFLLDIKIILMTLFSKRAYTNAL